MREIVVPEYLNILLRKIWKESNPVSIFLYGSMARDDFENDSDYEIGVVYKKDNKWSRQQLKNLHDYENVKIYPFVEEELMAGEIDTPFPKAIYLSTLLNGGIVLFGKNLEKIIKCPKVTRDDLFEAVGFCLGRAYSSVVSSRQNDWVAVRDGFTKSMFYGCQLLIFINTGKLMFSYKELDECARKLVTEEYDDLIKHAVDVRKGKAVIQVSMLYKNISFLNRIVLNSIKNSN